MWVLNGYFFQLAHFLLEYETMNGEIQALVTNGLVEFEK